MFKQLHASVKLNFFFNEQLRYLKLSKVYIHILIIDNNCNHEVLKYVFIMYISKFNLERKLLEAFFFY